MTLKLSEFYAIIKAWFSNLDDTIESSLAYNNYYLSKITKYNG